MSWKISRSRKLSIRESRTKNKFFVFRGFNLGDYDLWRVRSNKSLIVDFIGDKRGAGLNEKVDEIQFLNVHTFTFGPTDSKAIASTMPGIKIV